VTSADRGAGPAARLPAGVVFDCDGTLVDTEPLSERAWERVLGERGYAPTERDFAAVLGHPAERSFAYFDERVPGGLGPFDAFRAEYRGTFAELFDAGVRVFDDAVTTIRALHAAGVPVAVASSSRRAHVARSLAACGLAEVVVAAFGADDVREPKPHPEPYLAAARALRVPPGRCSAVEDSRVGVASARAARRP
jgi:HAD superfamily hydrolase (TIGR01509 family)